MFHNQLYLEQYRDPNFIYINAINYIHGIYRIIHHMPFKREGPLFNFDKNPPIGPQIRTLFNKEPECGTISKATILQETNHNL